jgi:DNA polymerase I-like protein with 3'-5' exonuclease and polymerase domains
MPRCQRLGDLEIDGIAVNDRRLQSIKERLLEQVASRRSEIFAIVGRTFDLDSQPALSEILREVAELHDYIGPRRLTVSALEHLAVVEPVARLIVEVRRLRSRVARLESISAASHHGRIYPIFNQIKSRTGLVASVGPSIFDIEGISDLKSCFDRRVHDLFVDEKTSLRRLAKVTKDAILENSTARRGNVYPGMEKDPLMPEIDSEDLLLRLAVGHSDTVLSKKFLVDRFKIATMRRDLEKRYHTMFRWLMNYRRRTRTAGYATNGHLRKCIDGLKSADVSRREQALQQAVRWLVCC